MHTWYNFSCEKY